MVKPGMVVKYKNQELIGKQQVFMCKNNNKLSLEVWCQFIHVFLSSTQFSSDQIQNGGVNSERRTIAILACACANDVPVEFTLVWGTLLFSLEDI